MNPRASAAESRPSDAVLALASFTPPTYPIGSSYKVRHNTWISWLCLLPVSGIH
jgi:hypothetical protein